MKGDDFIEDRICAKVKADDGKTLLVFSSDASALRGRAGELASRFERAVAAGIADRLSGKLLLSYERDRDPQKRLHVPRLRLNLRCSIEKSDGRTRLRLVLTLQRGSKTDALGAWLLTFEDGKDGEELCTALNVEGE